MPRLVGSVGDPGGCGEPEGPKSGQQEGQEWAEDCTLCYFPEAPGQSLQFPLPGGSDARRTHRRKHSGGSHGFLKGSLATWVQTIPLIFTQSGGILHKLEQGVNNKPCA